MQEIQCLLRKEWVAATPEELVRQKLIQKMIMELGFPRNFLSVEKKLDHLPHVSLKGEKVPLRRSDILCFGKGIHPEYDLYPLLLIECKAVKITSKVLQQVIGYNHYLKAYYVCVANETEILTGRYDTQIKQYQFEPTLPSYQHLLTPRN